MDRGLKQKSNARKDRGRHIGIIHYTAPPNEVGGVEIVISAHTDFLAKRGYKIHLIYGSGGGFKTENVFEHQIPLLSPKNVEIVNVQNEVLKMGVETESFNKVKERIKSQLRDILTNLDVCIVHNIPSMPFNFAATAAINELADELETKFIFWVHDIAIVRKEWHSRAGKFPLTLLLHKNPRIEYVTISYYRLKQLQTIPLKHSLGRIHVIPNGVKAEDFLRFDALTKELMNKLGIDYQDLVILIPVRVTPRKNLELALDIVYELKMLLGGERKVKALITGPPDHQAVAMGVEYLEYLNMKTKMLGLEDNVRFCHELIGYERTFSKGKIVKWNVADAYTISDLVLVPSKEEGFGLPIIEAAAARKMMFVSKIPPFEELIYAGINGYMFYLNDSPKNIAYKIFKEFTLQAPDTNIVNVAKNVAYKIYKMLLMDAVEPNLGDIAKNMLNKLYKVLIMNFVDPDFSYVMDKFAWNIILQEKLVPLL